MVLTVFLTTDCGHCRRLKAQLQREGIAYDEIDVEADASAAEYVMRVNGGNRIVPTVRFADGTALTNPTIIDVQKRLAAAP
jgi:mycoredoxin